MPSFVLTEFIDFSDLKNRDNPAWRENVYPLRDALEKVLLEHECVWIHPDGKKMLAIFENDRALLAALESLDRLRGLGDRAKPAFKMAVHHGEAYKGQKGWFGPHVDHAFRILEVAPVGHLLVSSAATSLPLPPAYRRSTLGLHLLRDLWEPEELFTLVPRERPYVDIPIPRSLGAYEHNLKPQPTPFVCRREELESLTRSLMDPSVKLITLLASGGGGKTRLALQLAADMVGRYDGVYWVALAPLSSAERISAAIAEALRIVVRQGEDPLKRVVDSLVGRRILLVFDNFEHLIEGRELVTKLLEIPMLQVLVTSRVTLNLPLERVVPIQGLQYPASPEDPAFEEFSAIHLFLLCLGRQAKARILRPEEKAELLELCSALHGMPLGIEMMAALAGDQPIAEMVRRLRTQIDTVFATMPHLPERQRSVRAVFDYSWALLDESLKRSLCRLSILKGNLDSNKVREAVVCPPGDLERLSDRSLLVRKPKGKYELHEIIRFFAKERLHENAQENRAAEEAHARYFLMFLQARLSLFRGPEQRRYLEETTENIWNIRDAFGWAAREGEFSWIETALAAYGTYFERTSRFLEGWDAMEALLSAVEGGASKKSAKESETLRGRLLVWKSVFAVYIGRPKDAVADIRKALRIHGKTGKSVERGAALQGLGYALAAMGRFDEAEKRLRESSALFRRAGDERGSALARNRLCEIRLLAGDAAGVFRWADQSRGFYEKSGDSSMMAWSHLLMGAAASSMLDFTEARRHFDMAFELYLSVGNREGVGGVMTQLGLLAMRCGEAERAWHMFREALAIEKEVSNPAGEAKIRLQIGITAWHRGMYSEARLEYGISLEIFRRVGDHDGAYQVLMRLARLALTEGHLEEAENYCAEALRESANNLKGPRKAWHLFQLAELSRAKKRLAETRALISKSLRLFRAMKHPYGIGWSRHFEGELAAERGQWKASEKAFREALAIAKSENLLPMVLECLLGLASVMEKRGQTLKAMARVEAILLQPCCTGMTRQKAEDLRARGGASLSAEERDFALHAASGVDLSRWSDEILRGKTTGVKRLKSTGSGARRARAPKSGKSRARSRPRS